MLKIWASRAALGSFDCASRKCARGSAQDDRVVGGKRPATSKGEWLKRGWRKASPKKWVPRFGAKQYLPEVQTCAHLSPDLSGSGSRL
jgi:hypothetical protein